MRTHIMSNVLLYTVIFVYTAAVSASISGESHWVDALAALARPAPGQSPSATLMEEARRQMQSTFESPEPLLKAHADWRPPPAIDDEPSPVHVVGDPFIKGKSGMIFYKGDAIVISHGASGEVTALDFVAVDPHIGVWIHEVWQYTPQSGKWKYRKLDGDRRPQPGIPEDIFGLPNLVVDVKSPWQSHLDQDATPDEQWLKRFEKGITWTVDNQQGDAFPGPSPSVVMSALLRSLPAQIVPQAIKNAPLIRPALHILNNSIPSRPGKRRLDGSRFYQGHHGTFMNVNELETHVEAHAPGYAALADAVFVTALVASFI